MIWKKEKKERGNETSSMAFPFTLMEIMRDRTGKKGGNDEEEKKRGEGGGMEE